MSDNCLPLMSSLDYHTYYSRIDLYLEFYYYTEDAYLNDDFLEDNYNYESLSNEAPKIRE